MCARQSSHFFFPFFLFFFLGVFFVPAALGGEPTLLATSSPPSSSSSSASESLIVDVVDGCLSIIVGLGDEVRDPFADDLAGVEDADVPALLFLPFTLPPGVVVPFVGEPFLD